MLHALRRLLPASVAVSIALVAITAAPPARAESPAQTASPAGVPSYTIDLDVDYAAGTYTGRQTVRLTNPTNDTWSHVSFSVMPAALGTFNLTEATVDGAPVEAAWEGSVLRLPVSPGLAPGREITLGLAYSVVPPRSVGRFGFANSILALGSFYPELNVYRQGPLTFQGQPEGWSAHQYVAVGDAFFTEAADYDVTVRLAQPATVAATGRLTEQAGQTWRFQGERLREFALAISDRYRVESIRVGSTVVAAYYLPEHAAAGQKYLHIARPALQWLTQTLGEYPYPQLSIVEMSGDTLENVGQEYPGLIMMSGAIWPQSDDLSDYLSYLLAHEIAHQWFYGIVGSDAITQPWLDEALVTWLGKHWQTRVVGNGNTGGWTAPAHAVDASIYDFPSNAPYFNVIYREGSALIEDFYQTLGSRVFFYALRDYAQTFQNRIASPTTFLDLVQGYTPRNLNPIISQYLRYAKYQTDQPLRATAWAPATWAGDVPVTIASADPLTRVTLYLDNRQIWAGPAAENLTIDARQLPRGDHLLTAVIEDAAGRTVERARRITVTEELPVVAGR